MEAGRKAGARRDAVVLHLCITSASESHHTEYVESAEQPLAVVGRLAVQVPLLQYIAEWGIVGASAKLQRTIGIEQLGCHYGGVRRKGAEVCDEPVYCGAGKLGIVVEDEAILAFDLFEGEVVVFRKTAYRIVDDEVDPGISRLHG